MFNFKKVVLPVFLTTSILLPVVVYAEDINSSDSSHPNTNIEYKDHCHKHKHKDEELKNLEKFVPGAEIQLKQVLDEQKQLSKQFRELTNSKLGVDTSFMNEFKKTIGDIHNKVENGKMTEEEAEKSLKEEKEKFHKEHTSEIEKLKEAREKYNSEHRDEITARKQNEKQAREAHKALKDAIKSGDAQKVKSEFNSYLSTLKAVNKLLQNQINSLK